MPILNSLDESNFITHWSSTTNPGAGNDASIAVPISGQMQLTHLSFLLTTDANAGNRNVRITLETAGISIPFASNELFQTASQVFTYVGHKHQLPNAAAPVSHMRFSLPDIRIIDPTATIDITVDGIKAGDTLTLIRSYWKNWHGTG